MTNIDVRLEDARGAKKGGLAARPERGTAMTPALTLECPAGQRGQMVSAAQRPRRSIVGRANHRKTPIRLKPRRRIGLLYRWFVAVMICG